MTRCRDSWILLPDSIFKKFIVGLPDYPLGINGIFALLAKIAKARAPLFVALALPHGQQAVDHTAENLGYHGVRSESRTHKLGINIEKPCEIQSRYGPSTISNLFSVFKNRLQICKPRIWKSHRFVDPLILGSRQLRKHSEVSQTSVSCSLQFHYSIAICWFLFWYLLIDISGCLGRTRNNMKPTRLSIQGKTIETTTRYLKSSPWKLGKTNEILRKPQNPKIKTHLNKSTAVSSISPISAPWPSSKWLIRIIQSPHCLRRWSGDGQDRQWRRKHMVVNVVVLLLLVLVANVPHKNDL